MRTIFKYVIGFPSMAPAHVVMPAGGEVIHVGYDGSETLCLWADVDSSQPPVQRTFLVFGTGFELPPGELRYLGTAHQPPAGYYIWHIYERMG